MATEFMSPPYSPMTLPGSSSSGQIRATSMVVALYEPDAVLTFPPGNIATGRQEIRAVYAKLLADRPTLTPGRQQPALVSADLALTSTHLDGGGITVEVARRQPDGTWLWVIDRFDILQ